MKKLIFGILTSILLVLAGCKSVPASASNPIVGVWNDSYGLAKYHFYSDGTMKLTALNFGSFHGTYCIEDSEVTIQYKVAVKEVEDTYTFRIDGNTLYLDDQPFYRKK